MDLVGDGTIEKPIPENMGIDTGIMSLAGRGAKIEGGAKLHPPALYVTESVRLSAG